ncbi:hypothetical protein NCAS_0A04910 [Naumovozyma castellii]|uniref:Uncharacterized protein n=1 Tax=Naumovozyma castellii TaxID=27288 RepID=G0V6F7_NAUCA|nr:hypothetical protein NCAS_0A04910 [Naumovozyma castellii CBS 4309]CCC67049.1 hypothetical protein NCAS_0A04910 [Naumovozyma castellii CBS 4309]
MGAILSCCKGHTDEEDPLLRNPQDRYGGTMNGDDPQMTDGYSEALRLKQEEKKAARDKELKQIVTDTNDKLIDISMINNSGIVLESNDSDWFKKAVIADEGEATDNQLQQSTTEQATTDTILSQEIGSTYKALDPEEHLTAADKQRLQTTLRAVIKEIEDQVHIDVPGELTVTI